MPRSLVSMLLALGSLVATLAAAQSTPSTIGVDEIVSGMRGYGLTVFRGTTPERFEVEVIDVLHGFRPDQDLILVRTEHPILERARTVAGMSGSPIYLDGRLAGAYAYGWPFGLDPVAGVTPIRNMLHELNRPVRPGAFPGARVLPPRPAQAHRGQRPTFRRDQVTLPPYQGGPLDIAAHLRTYAQHLRPPERGAEAHRLVPAATPLMLAGFGPHARAYLAESLEPLGMVPLQGGGSGDDPATDPSRFVDGGAIGVQLIRGDISATAVGTVTHVGGRRLVAFGHPMMNAGQSGLPTCTARVLHILASRSRSFKIAEGLSPRGALVHDRQSAIVVDQEMQASTVPLQIRVHGIEGSPRNEWNVELANHRALTPVLAFSALLNALGAIGSDHTEVGYRVDARVDIVGAGIREVSDWGYMPDGPISARELAGLRVFRLIEAALGNPFEASYVRRINLDLHFDYGRRYAEIIDASLPFEEVDPGATVPLQIRERRYDQSEQIRTIPLRVPRQAAGHTLHIRVEPGNRVTLNRPTPRNLDQLIQNISLGYSSRSIVVSARLRSSGLRFRGHITRNLPGSALHSLLPTNAAQSAHSFITYDRNETTTQEVILGAANLRVRVRAQARGR